MSSTYLQAEIFEKESVLDHFTKGEIGEDQFTSMDATVTGDTIEQLIEALNNFYLDDVTLENLRDTYQYFDYERYVHEQMEKGDGSIPSSEDLKLFEQDKIKLYSCRYSIKFKRITEEEIVL